jgi:hypothetical protein
MEKLTVKQKELQKQIISYALDQSINADVKYLKDGESVTLLFTYSDNKTRDQIFTLKRKIQDKFKCYFDSGFFTQEPVIEWSLDWSLDNID